jgi:hypothetical protein
MRRGSQQRVYGTLALCLLAILVSGAAFAQGTTGEILGTVTSGGQALAGATVTIASASLQGTRTTTTGEAGGYDFPNLPPGDYTVTFDFAGTSSVRRAAAVQVATTTRADAEMRVAPISETVTVTGGAAATESTQISTNFKIEAVNELPVTRTINSITLLAPGTTNAGPTDQITISGAYSYDNLFLVDGVVVNENARGQPGPLYIEDAIQETTVLTGGVSAEFGRFTGGVVSTITKSGGNDFSGSLRDNITNPSWTLKTAFPGQPDRLEQTNHQYEGTLGGRIVRDRLWFFTAGRYENPTKQARTTLTSILYLTASKDRRYEPKLTAQLTPKQSLVGSYIDQHEDAPNSVAGAGNRVLDLRSLVPNDRRRSLLSVNYSSVASQNLLLEGQFSRMRDRFTNGAETRDLVEGTLLIDTTSGNRMWASTFCGSPCPAKQRNNKEYLGKASYFLSTRALGNHSFVGGFDEFHQLRNENNFQSGSDFRILGITLCDKGGVATPCASLATTDLSSPNVYFGTDTSAGQIAYDPVPSLSRTSDFAIRTLFVNDKWDLNSHWSFNAGGRYDIAFGKDQSGIKTVDDRAMSPRLAAAFDPKGNGQHRFSVTYGRYVSKVDQGPADSTSTAGRYAAYYWDYKGPEINRSGTPIGQLLPTDQVIQQIFEWFNSVGGTKAGPPLLTKATIPGTTNRFDHSLQAPYMDEMTAGYAVTLGSRGFVRADYIHRKWAKFYSILRTTATGKAVDANGITFDQGLIENSDASLSRRYNALQLQGNVRLLNALTAGGNYTHSKLRGNVEGESQPNATTFTTFENYPEYTNFAQFNPVGYLAPDIRHRANVWLRYDLHTPIGLVNLSLLQRYQSPLSYSAVGTIDVRAGAPNGPANGVVNPGYSTPPTSVTYFFSDRGAFRLKTVASTDLGMNFYLRSIRGVRPFLETDLVNVFNRQGIEDPDFVNQIVLTRRQATCIQSGSTARCVAFNPFTDAPRRGVNWQYGPTFGQPTSPNAYQSPRQYRFSVGLKF